MLGVLEIKILKLDLKQWKFLVKNMQFREIANS